VKGKTEKGKKTHALQAGELKLIESCPIRQHTVYLADLKKKSFGDDQKS
jgi:hypothetical protein